MIVPGYMPSLQVYTAVGDRKSELRIFFLTFYVKYRVCEPYYMGDSSSNLNLPKKWHTLHCVYLLFFI